MLQWWADYVDSIVNEAKVIVGNFGFAGLAILPVISTSKDFPLRRILFPK